ncbi:MAG: extracellular solute-binding protein, partial [Anaerolineae bacterium]|nr:extracellular solute-binding protein [Anaerolineae bacterium]
MSEKRITRRELVRQTAVASAGVVLAACAPAPAKEPTKAATKVSEPVATQAPGGPTQAPAPAEPITIKYAHWGPPDEAKANVDLVAAFEERNPGVKVEINHIPQDFYTKILTLISAGTPPDVFYTGEAWVPKWGATGAAKDLVPYIQRDGIDESIWFEAGVQQLKTPQHELFGMPTYLGPFMVYYNRDVFDEAGVEYPITEPTGDWTVDDVRAKGERLLKKSADGRIERYATEPWAHWLHWIPTVRSFGGEILSDDLTRSLLDQPEAVEAIQWLADNMLVHKIAPSPLVMNEMGKSGTDLVLGGICAMWGAGSWGAWGL